MKNKISVLPRRVRLGSHFIVECLLLKPKTRKGRNLYAFSIRPIVPHGKKFRTYSTLSFPGVVKANFVELK